MIFQPCPTQDLYETGRGTGRGLRDHRAAPGPFALNSQRLRIVNPAADDGAALSQAAAVPGGASLAPDAPPKPIQPHPRAQPCRIRGVLYPSQRAAASAVGVSEGAISIALTEGWQDQVGLGPRKGGQHPNARPVFMNGTRWPSMADAARALNVSRAAISFAAQAGRTHVRPGKPRHV